MTAYASTLEQITEDNRSYGDEPQLGATKAELDTLRQRASDELSVRLPDAYLEFLRNSNGLDYNGTVIYSTHRVPITGYDDRFIEGFVGSNLDAREVEDMKRYLVFGESNESLHVLNVAERRYQTIESIGYGVYQDYDSFDDMIAAVLEEACS